MKHNILKRTLATGLAVLCVAAYAPTFGNTGLFDTAITASAMSWTITEGSSLKCSQTQEVDGDLTVKDGGKFTIVDNATLTLTGSFTAESNSIIILGAASKIIAKSIDFSSTNVTVPDGYAVKITDTCIKTIPQWESGDCTVTLDTDDGTLTVSKMSGNGAMDKYSGPSGTPWYQYADQITAIVIKSGVTVVGDYCFGELESLKTVTVNANLESVGYNAFYGCENLETVTFAPQESGEIEFVMTPFNGCSGVIAYSEGSTALFDKDDNILKAGTALDDIETGTFNWGATTRTLDDGKYAQGAVVDNVNYTRFVYVLPLSELHGKKQATFTVTKGDASATFVTSYYYTGMVNSGVTYIPANETSVMLICVVKGGAPTELTCTLSIDGEVYQPNN